MGFIEVHVTEEYLRTQLMSPPKGVRELVDNALDADAENVQVVIERGDLDRVLSVTVSDDGHGMTHADAQRAFGDFGASPKRTAKRSRTGRTLRGRRGKGRYAAFSIGDAVTWSSVVAEAPDAALNKIVVKGNRGNLTRFEALDPEPVDGVPTGTTVSIEDVGVSSQALRVSELQKSFTSAYAGLLYGAPGLSLTIQDGSDFAVISADDQIRQTTTLTIELDGIEALDRDFAYDTPTLILVEWKAKPKVGHHPALALCDVHGRQLHEVACSSTATFSWSAYLRWNGFSHHRGVLLLIEAGAQPLSEVMVRAQKAIREHLSLTLDERQRALIQKWRDEHSYPFQEEPETLMQETERSLFDLVAVTAAPSLENADVRSRKLSLRLIREALAHTPDELGRVLRDVLELPEQRLTELTALLERTTLASIIKTASVVASRTDVIDGLKAIIFDTDLAAHVLERKHLHEILAAEPWVFGDEYLLSRSDRGLTELLRAHRQMLSNITLVEDLDTTPNGTATAYDEPVLMEGRVARIDLLLSRVLEESTERIDHLIVELKRPNHEITLEDVTQLQRYAFTIAEEPRFAGVDVRWDYLIVGASLHPHVLRQANKDGVIYDKDGVRIRVLHWGRLLEHREHTLKWVQRELELEQQTDSGLTELRRLHAEHLPAEAFGEDQAPTPARASPG